KKKFNDLEMLEQASDAWIPFNKSKKIGEDGFSTIYLAEWTKSEGSFPAKMEKQPELFNVMDFHKIQNLTITIVMPYEDKSSLSDNLDEDQKWNIWSFAPEILKQKLYTKAVDIYAFGVIMAEISTGRRPFD
ncbi:19833_t:CDS:2, partial [Racocetra fulgida]